MKSKAVSLFCRTISVAYLFLPIGFVKYQQEQQGLEKNSTHHTTPKSLNREKISERNFKLVSV